ncbi:MAG: hypothetical protein P4L71_15450 [Acetobacteraceae bacterium]|nr:hypothetical protein [Acetobacteraceae bacterium]
MSNIVIRPLTVLAVSLVLQVLAAYGGDYLRRRGKPLGGDERSDFATLLPAALTLLALIVGFTFSMAVGRYDQRKNYEEAEANAIGTEYVRADLLPAADAQHVRAWLADYTRLRIRFYETRDERELGQINARTAALQQQLWSAAAVPAVAQPTPVAALVAAGMNDVLNSQGYTQAAWWNRIPLGAWLMLGAVGAFCNLLFGYSERRGVGARLLTLPIILTIPLVLIADIDTPRYGIIHVLPQNLIALSQSLGPH